MRLPYVGYVRSWEPRVRFGKSLPVPWDKPYRVVADSASEAKTVLGMKAKADGYGLGGIHTLTIDAEKLDAYLV